MKTNLILYFFLIFFTNQMSTDFLFRPNARKLIAEDELPSSYKVNFYHEIRIQLLSSLRNYLYKDATEYDGPDHENEEGINLKAFAEKHIKEKVVKEPFKLKLHEIENEDTRIERLEDHEIIELELFSDLEEKIIDIHIDPDLKKEEVDEAVKEDLEGKDEPADDETKNDDDLTGGRKKSLGQKMKKEQLVIVLDNGVVQSKMKLFYANHINKAIKEFINLNIWKFMEKTRQIIRELDEIAENVNLVLVTVFNNDSLVGGQFLDETEKQAKEIEFLSDDQITAVETLGEGEEIPHIDKPLSIEVKEDEQPVLIKYAITHKNVEHADDAGDDQILKQVIDLIAKKEVTISSEDKKIHYWTLKPVNYDAEPIEIIMFKSEKSEAQPKENEEDEEKLIVTQKILILITSSYFSFQYEFNILTKRFILKNIERIVKRIKNEILLYLQVLEQSPPDEEFFNGEEFGTIGDEGRTVNFHEEGDYIPVSGDIGTLQKDLVELTAIAPKDDNPNKEDIHLNIKYEVEDQIEEEGGEKSKTAMDTKKSYPISSQYNTSLFFKSYVNFIKDVNFYILPIVKNEETLEENDSVYKEMSNPFIGKETVIEIAKNTQEISALEIDDNGMKLIDLMINYGKNSHTYNFDYKFKVAEEGTQAEDSFFKGFPEDVHKFGTMVPLKDKPPKEGNKTPDNPNEEERI